MKREQKLRLEEEERIRRERDRAKAEEIMLRKQEEARHRIPKAPPPPPVVEMMAEDLFLDMEEDESESVVLDTGMHTVKVSGHRYGSSSVSSIVHLRLEWLVMMFQEVFFQPLLGDQDTGFVF